MEMTQERRDAERQAKEAGVLLLVLLGLRRSSLDAGYDPNRARYIVDGKLVPISVVLSLARKIEDAGVRNARALTQRMLDGKLTVEEWGRRMRRLIGAQHVLQAALALGSLETAETFPTVTERKRSEEGYLLGFISGLKAGQVSPGRALSRAASYMMAASATFHIVNQQANSSAGKTEAKRVRRAAESCRGCIAYSAKWLPISEMPPIGTLECGSHCRCYLIFR